LIFLGIAQPAALFRCPDPASTLGRGSWTPFLDLTLSAGPGADKVAKRLECVELAPAFPPPRQTESASKPRTLSGQAGGSTRFASQCADSRARGAGRLRPPMRKPGFVFAQVLCLK
jgi:hypothetical protein